ncbi:MAG: putative lipid II flippase FtsW [Candidatus Dormibacteria bacterium]
MATRARPATFPALRLRDTILGGRVLSLGGVDGWLLTDIAGLCAFGLVMVYSASEALGYLWFNNPSYFFDRQVIGMLLGIIGLVVAARIDYHRLLRHVNLLALGLVAALVLVLVPHIGSQANGAQRWFTLGPFSVQPSAIAIPVAIVFFSRWLTQRAPAIRTWRGVRDYGLLLALLLGLVLLERDLGSSIIIAGTATVLLALGGAKKRHLIGFLLLGLLAGLLLITTVAYRSSRLGSYTHPCSDPLNTGYQGCQALYALGSGGLGGVGLGNSVQKYQWLPEAHTDFIFAIIGEELGLIGTASVVLAFTLLLWRGIRASFRAPDAAGALLAGGVTAWIGLQAFVNIGAVTGVIPTTGIPLPFISYGGTSLVFTLVGMGILCNISAQGRRQGVTIRAHADRRRGYGWAPDAGPGRGAGAAPH